MNSKSLDSFLDMGVNVVRIPKGGGKFRSIYIPHNLRQKLLKRIAKEAVDAILKLDCDHVHGFMPLRSPVTNALAHVGFEYSLSMDLQDFFDSVTIAMIDGVSRRYGIGWSFVSVQRMTHEGSLRQGFCSSPAVANLAAMEMDRKIMEVMKGLGSRAVYTRYADDMVVSSDDPSMIGSMAVAIDAIARSESFAVNPRKTSIQMAKAGRRMICGVAVDRDGIYCPRAIRRRLRSARHKVSVGSQRHVGQMVGLQEWSRLKAPYLGKAGREHASALHHALVREKYEQAMAIGFKADCLLGEELAGRVRSRVVSSLNNQLENQRGKEEVVSEG